MSYVSVSVYLMQLLCAQLSAFFFFTHVVREYPVPSVQFIYQRKEEKKKKRRENKKYMLEFKDSSVSFSSTKAVKQIEISQVSFTEYKDFTHR